MTDEKTMMTLRAQLDERWGVFRDHDLDFNHTGRHLVEGAYPEMTYIDYDRAVVVTQVPGESQSEVVVWSPADHGAFDLAD